MKKILPSEPVLFTVTPSSKVCSFKRLIQCVLIMMPVVYSIQAKAQTCNTDLTNGIALANITASGENAPTQTKDKAFDNKLATKWLTFANSGYLQVDLGAATVVTTYSITSADDVPARDPKDFSLLGSNDGITFTTLDSRAGEVFTSRYSIHYYSFSNNTAYRYYKLLITANSGDAYTQLAEMQLLPNANCVVGNVYNGAQGVGYPSIPVVVRTFAGTTGSTTTDASGHFAFTTSQVPGSIFSILILPPANTYFAAGPSINLDSSIMSSAVYNYAKQELWANGAFFNLNDSAVSTITGTNYMINNTKGIYPASFDWVLKPSAVFTKPCASVPTTIDGNGTFGNLSAGDYIAQHSYQPNFHNGAITKEPHPTLFKSLSSATTQYIYSDTIISGQGVLYPEGSYNITSFIGTIEDPTYFYNANSTGGIINSSFSLLNGFNGGWRKTYGHTTGDPYDLFLAGNGQTTEGTIVKFSANVTSAGIKYLNFYGKNANSFAQNINTPVEFVFSVYDSSNNLVAASTLTLSPVSSPSQDDPQSPWEGRSFSFNAPGPGAYTFNITLPTTSVLGNDFYMDDIILSDCPVQNVLSGTVWDDANGDLSQAGAEAGTNAGGLFVNLVDASNHVVSSVPVNADGSYTILVPQNLNGYSLVLTTSASSNSPALPTFWVNTGENVNSSNTAVQNSTLGVIQLNTSVSDIIKQNFGIEKLPTSNNVSQTIPDPLSSVIASGTISASVAGMDLEDGALSNSTTFVVTALPLNAVMYYNGSQISLNQSINNFNPKLLSFNNIAAGSTSIAFNYSFIDAASKQGLVPASYTINWLTALPILLSGFEIQQANCNEISLHWKVGDAVNFSHFEIMRSGGNGLSFVNIGTVDYLPNEGSYTWQDVMPSTGTFQYRLNMIDIDGNSSYSKILVAKSNCNIAEVYPNPVSRGSNLLISVSNLQPQSELIVYSANGAVVQRKRLINAMSSLTTGNMAAGVYYYSIRNSDGTMLGKGNFIVR